jgi:TRAP-type uncharacterized transport system fused permease subunit
MGAFAVPYFFVYDPALLAIDVTWLQIVLSFVTAIAGGVAASIAMIGTFAHRLTILERLLFVAAAVCFLSSDWWTDVIGLILALALMAWDLRRAPPADQRTTEIGPEPIATTQKGELQ